MHIVRGVSAFLRKGSTSHSSGEGSDGQGENFVQPPSWPEVQFRQDGDEALLEFLWQGYQEASGLEESQKALESFLASLVRILENWMPTDELEAIEVLSGDMETKVDDRGVGVSVSVGTILGCARGHPTRVIVGLIQELKGTIRCFTALHANPDGSSDAWLSTSDMESALRLLHALTILTRSFHNRRIFSFFGGLHTLMGVMKAAVVQLKGVASVVISDSIITLSASMQLSFLQCLLTHIVSIVANYIDAEACLTHKCGVSVKGVEPIMCQQTGRDIVGSACELSATLSRPGSRRTLQKRSPSGSGIETPASRRLSGGAETPGNRSGRETPGVSNGSVPLLETGGLNWFVELLRILQRLRLKGTISDASLEQLALRTLRATIMANPRTQNHFRSIGGLEVLLDGLGTPRTTTDGRGTGIVDSSAARKTDSRVDSAHFIGTVSFNKLLDEFQMQVLSLQVLREAMDSFRNVTSLQCIRDNGGIQKFMEVIRWAAFTFPEMAVMPNSSLDSSPNFSQGNVNSLRSRGNQQGSRNPRSRRNVKATPSGFISVMLNTPEKISNDGVNLSAVPSQGPCGSEDVLVEEDNLQGWNWRVADLCRILCSFLVPAGDVPSFAGGLQGGQEGLGVSCVYWELATRCIVNVLLGVFRGGDNMGCANEALPTSRLLSSTLQHYVLHVLKKMLEVSPSVLQLFREDGVWEVMFSQYFFYFGLGEWGNSALTSTNLAALGGSLLVARSAASKASESHSTTNCGVEATEETFPQIPDSVDTEPLRLEVISFVELAATVNGTVNNLPECSALLEALRHCWFLPSIATMLAKSLHRILQLVTEPAMSAFQKLDATTILSEVMEHQRQASLKISIEEIGLSGSQPEQKVGIKEDGRSIPQVPVETEPWPQARWALFSVIAEFFAVSEKAVVEASRNLRAVDALFNLLWDSSTRTFALRHILLLMKLAPASEQDQEAKMNLCFKYLESLPRAQVECRSTEISLVLDLLAGLRDVLQSDLTYYQALFREGECFVHIVSLLNEDHTKEAGSQLSLDVVMTLTHLLQGNEASKGAFRGLVGTGYKTLQSLLIERHQGSPSQGLLTALLDMLVDGGFQMPANMLIQNEDVVLLFFNMLRNCDIKEQFNGLDTFHRLLEESTANRASCVRAGLLTVLLDWFAVERGESLIVKVAQLMQMIGGHSISGKDMRRIFALLRSTKEGLRPRHGTLLLQILQGMLKEQGPAVFFELSGRDSGIVISTPLRWPSNRGFSFCCWARVESFPLLSSRKSQKGMMGLFSFLSESGKGCTALLGDGQFVIESISHKRQSIPLKVTLRLKHWHFICVMHSTGRALTGGNSLKVFLDGELAASEKLRYPKVGEMLTRCTIGACSPLPAVNGGESEAFSGAFSAPFCGQLGPTYLFDDAMSVDQVMGVYSLGPGYMYSFLPTEVGCVPENVSAQSVIDSKEGLSSKMIFGFNAQASAGRALFDVSPVLEQSLDPVLYDATIMAGTLLCYRRLVQDSVHCVGGISVFFPLLTQLDQPVCEAPALQDTVYVPPLPSCNVTGEKKYVDSYPLESHVAVEVIELVTAVLAGKFANQQYMHNIAGMSVLGFLLQSVSPQHLTVKVVAALERLLATVAKANGAYLAEALLKEALLKLYLNPHIWIFTPFVVQRELYMSLLNYGENEANHLASVCGLSRVLDFLRQFYWDKPKSRKALGTKPLLHPLTKAVIGERPTQTEVAKLRLLVLGLAEKVVRDRVTLTDTTALVAFIETSEDTACLQDVLLMVLGLLRRKPFVSALVEHVYTLGGYQIFVNLLRRQQETIRLLGLRLIGALLVATPLEKKGIGVSLLGTSRSGSELQRAEKHKLNLIFSLITERLMMYPFTDAVRATLFDVLLGGASPKQVLQESFNGEDGLVSTSRSRQESLSLHLQNFVWSGGKTSGSLGAFVLPQMLGIIFKLMVDSQEPMLRLEILTDVLHLLETSPLNNEALALEPAWQSWLFAVLVAAVKQSRKNLGESADEVVWMMGPEEKLIRKMFCTFHVHSICTLRGGWRHVERTLNFVHMYADEGQLSKFHTLHALLGDLFDVMVQGLPLHASLFTQPCRDNVLYLLALVDELVMGDAFRLLPFPFPGDAITDDTTDSSLLSGGYVDLGFSTLLKPISRRNSVEEAAMVAAAQGLRRKSAVNRPRGWQRRTSQGEVIEIVNKSQYWCLYDSVWSLLIAMNGRGTASGGSFVFTGASGPTLGQRARGLVESLNIPAAEMAAAVVSGGLGVVGMGSPGRLVDKASRLRGERCPRVVFRLVLLYLFEADLEAASRCVQQFLALLPAFLSTENEQNKNRLQLLLWTLLDARAQIGSMDDGARVHVVSQLIRETVESGKAMLATTLADKERSCEEGSSSESAVQSLLQLDRVVAAVKEEARYLKSATAQRVHEVEGLRSESNEASLQDSQQKKELDDQSQSVLSAICANDRTRRASAQLAYDEEQQAISKHWCHMFRDLTDERGPWSAIPFPNDFPVRWKLDKTEDPWRRRLKLKRNYHFNGELLHPASVTPLARVLELLSEPRSAVDLHMGGVRTFLLKGLRGVSEESDSDNEEDKGAIDLETEMEVGTSEVVGSGLQRPEQGGNVPERTEEAGVPPQQPQIAATAEAGEEEVLLSVSCVLIAPKRKEAGRLEVMRSSLHFYGEFVVEGTGGRSVFNQSGGLNYPDANSVETAEKPNHRAKLSYHRESSTEVGDTEKGNSMERLDPMQQCTAQGGSFKELKRHRRWDLTQVKAVHATRFLLQYSALEIFFSSSIPPVFFNFPSQRLAKDVGTTVVYLCNGPSTGKSSSKDREDMIYYVDKRKAIDLAERARERWRRREMSNFDYLMILNTLAGRSYNDFTQYPVFPWVIADYSSDKLDLSNPNTFRDLSKPVGALNTKRFEVFEERYQNFSDPDIPSFYYGSHYSSMGIVLFYLLRLEPFTSLHRHLQGGKFDHADRLFHSIEGAYKNCLTNTSDVKELVPEFYYLPEFLTNTNEYFLGVKQDGEQLSNVVLPVWAKGTAEVFVQKNREALESEYVSGHLHEWVDLIFGYKQRGRPAMEAANVFYHLTYEGAVDIEAMDNSLERAAVEDQIANFGQTPMQLFRKRHHHRGPATPVARPLYYAPASITLTSFISSAQSSGLGQKVSPLSFVGLIDGQVVTVNGNLTVMVRAWITPALQSGGNFTFSSSQDSLYGIGTDIALSRRLDGPFAEDVTVNPSCFGTLQVRSSCFLLTCGHWDNSFKVISLSEGRMVQSNCQHKDVVTCLSVAVDGSVVVTGSRDTTVMVWNVEISAGNANRRVRGFREAVNHGERLGKTDMVVISDKPRHVLCGHDDAVTCIAVRVELDIVVSGSKDATCIFHTLREGRYVRSLRHPNGSPITKLAVSQHGLVVVYSNEDLNLHVVSINGKWLAMADSIGRVNCLDISECGDFLVCGGDQGQVVVRNMLTLEVVRRYDGTGVPISSLIVTPGDCFLAGTQDGNLMVFSLEVQQQRRGSFFAPYMRARSVHGNLIPGS